VELKKCEEIMKGQKVFLKFVLSLGQMSLRPDQFKEFRKCITREFYSTLEPKVFQLLDKSRLGQDHFKIK